MKITNNLRESHNRVRRQDTTGSHNIEFVKEKFINYVKARIMGKPFAEQLQAINDIDLLIQKFSQILTTGSKQPLLPCTPTSQQKQALFYRERISNLERKIKDLKGENLNQMKQISNKEQEIYERDEQIFQIKQLLEEKEKAIIRLTKNLRTKPSGPELKSLPKQEQKEQQIKIVVNTPKASIPPQRVEKVERVFMSGEMTRQRQAWQQQKARLLRVIKQKDLKIYELIQSMESSS